MKIKKGDNVVVMIGKDRGKKGKVLTVFPEENRVVVEGINKMFRHVKAKRQGEKGQRVEFNAPLSICNVMLICPKCNQPTRVGYRLLETKKQRICKKCKGQI